VTPEALLEKADRALASADILLRDECLNLHWFETICEARSLIEAWRLDYNESRPHMALGNKTPLEYALFAGSSPQTKGVTAGKS
jgi:transposase InsO family protein